MKFKRFLKGAIVLGVAGSMFGLAGCSNHGLKANKTRTVFMQNKIENADIHTKFNEPKNTVDITLTKHAVNKFKPADEAQNAYRNTENNKKSKGFKKAKQLKKKYGNNIREEQFTLSSVKQVLTKISNNAKDKNMKDHITNSPKQYPNAKLVQAQLQPNKRIAKEQLAKLQKEAVHDMNIARANAMKRVRKHVNAEANKDRNKLTNNMNKQHIPASQQKQVMAKFNKKLNPQVNKALAQAKKTIYGKNNK